MAAPASSSGGFALCWAAPRAPAATHAAGSFFEPPGVGQLRPAASRPHSRRRTLAHLLADDPDFRLRASHLQSLLRLSVGYEVQGAQLQALLQCGELCKYFSVDWAAERDWQQSVVRLNAQQLVQDALGAQPLPGSSDQLVHAAIGAWSGQLHSEGGRAGLLAALALLGSSASARRASGSALLPAYALRLSDLAAAIAQLMATSSAQLAPLLPAAASWPALDAAALRALLSQPLNRRLLHVSSPGLATAAGDCTARLLVEQLAAAEPSWPPQQQQQQQPAQPPPAAEDLHQLPSFLFEFDSRDPLPKQAAVTKPGSLACSSSGGMIAAFQPEARQPAPVPPAPSTSALSTSSMEQPFSDATESIMRNSAFHHPSSWSSSHSVDALFRWGARECVGGRHLACSRPPLGPSPLGPSPVKQPRCHCCCCCRSHCPARLQRQRQQQRPCRSISSPPTHPLSLNSGPKTLSPLHPPPPSTATPPRPPLPACPPCRSSPRRCRRCSSRRCALACAAPAWQRLQQLLQRRPRRPLCCGAVSPPCAAARPRSGTRCCALQHRCPGLVAVAASAAGRVGDGPAACVAAEPRLQPATPHPAPISLPPPGAKGHRLLLAAPAPVRVRRLHAHVMEQLAPGGQHLGVHGRLC
jgi:hypothetical protein